jgi:aryl carrier-like protein
MELGTWYGVDVGPESEWPADFELARESGFDFVVLWDMRPPVGGRPGDVRRFMERPDKAIRAMDAAGRAGLGVYVGIWHPYSMGSIPRQQRLTWADGKTENAPDIFNLDWLDGAWVPYVSAATRQFSSQEAFRGFYLDDTFPVVPAKTTSYLSYSAADKRRFRQWLKQRYVSIANLSMRHKLARGYRSFEAVSPPRQPTDGLALWTDWTEARADWCEDFGRRTAQAFRTADRGKRHELVLSDQDYHIQCNALQYGVDYARMMRHFERFEIYMAARHQAVGRREMLANVEADVRLALEVAGGKPVQFHTWFADRISREPMSPALLSAVVERAAELGVQGIEIYTFKVADWRRSRTAGEMAPSREMSLEYNPALLRTIRRLAARLK